MNSRNFMEEFSVQIANRAAGTTGTTVLGDVVDCRGVDEVVGICPIATTTPSSAVLTLVWMHSSVSSLSSLFEATTASVDHTGAGPTSPLIDVVRPQKAYGRFKANPTGNGSSPIGAIVSIARHRALPVTQSTVAGVEATLFIEPST